MDAQSFEKSESGAESHYSNVGPCSQLCRAVKESETCVFCLHCCRSFSPFRAELSFFRLKVNQTAKPPQMPQFYESAGVRISRGSRLRREGKVCAGVFY